MSSPIHVVVMGVAGCGKSGVGKRLAQALDLPESFHQINRVVMVAMGGSAIGAFTPGQGERLVISSNADAARIWEESL